MFVVFEGLDSSGKKTQANMLMEKLGREGKVAELVDFPAYKTPFGSLVAKYLRGEYGPLEAIPPEIPSLLFALDRYQFKDGLFHSLGEGKVIIANRYTQSNIGFQGAKLQPEERADFIRWIEAVESRLPRADIVIFLDMPPDSAHNLGHAQRRDYLKGKKCDIHERDVEYQKRVREAYLQIARKEKWQVISCVDEKGSLKKPSQIHGEIWDKLKNLV